MAQPAALSLFARTTSLRAEGRTTQLFGALAAPSVSALTYESTWRPAKTVSYAFAACGALWLAAILSYVTFH